MKKILVSLLICTVGPATLACMPPPPGVPAYQLQLPFLSDLIESDAVRLAILDQGENVVIKSITPNSRYQITLSNGCKLKIGRDTRDASVGTCYELLPIIVESITCKK